jgi:hypothetical protein
MNRSCSSKPLATPKKVVTDLPMPKKVVTVKVRCSEAEREAWRALAPRGLSSFIRLLLNATAAAVCDTTGSVDQRTHVRGAHNSKAV